MPCRYGDCCQHFGGTQWLIICSNAQKGHLNSQNITVQFSFHTELHSGSLWNSFICCFLCCNIPLNMTAGVCPFSKHLLLSSCSQICQTRHFFGNMKEGLWDHLAVCVSVYVPQLLKAGLVEQEEITITIPYKHVTWCLKTQIVRSGKCHGDTRC
jgi:hypothetical protein